MTELNSNDEARTLGHEPLALNTRGVWIAAAVLVATIVASLAFIGWLLWYLSPGRRAPTMTDRIDQATPRAISVPDLDANQLDQLRALRREEREMLTTYAWTDPQAGIARIPIQRAIQVISERGLEAITFPAPVTATQTEAVTGQPPAAAETPAQPDTEGQPNE